MKKAIGTFTIKYIGNGERSETLGPLTRNVSLTFSPGTNCVQFVGGKIGHQQRFRTTSKSRRHK